jgi:peroxiredoxin
MKQKLESRRVADPVWKARYDGLVNSLIAAGVGQGALGVGDTSPDFMLSNAEGRLIDSATLFAKGPVVLSFYRGKWCPYCRIELDALREATAEIESAGATLVAVTAEDCGGALAAKRTRELDFEILCDPDNGLGLAFGLIFRLPPELRDHYRGIEIDFPVIYGNESWFLPIPATYVIGADGVIRHAYVNPEFRERLDPAEIVSVLKSLQAGA